MPVLVTLNTLRQYQSKTAIREVLGCLIKQPSLLAINKITVDDFVEAFHKVLFVAINNCFENGMERLDAIIIEDYLQNSFPSKYSIFKRNNGALYVDKAQEMATLENFSFNYKEMRKYTILRELVKEGTNVSEFFDPDEVDSEVIDEKRIFFEDSTADDILSFYRKKLLVINEQFSNRNTRESLKAGGDVLRKQKEEWKKGTAYGLSYASDFFTTVTYGMRKKRFNLCSASSGTGKTRLSCANLCKSFVPKYYKNGKWLENPHGTQNGVLYIGTEMELVEEIEPILLAYIADVPEKHITEGKYEEGEEERVDIAIDILDNSMIYLEYVPDYDISTLEKVIDFHVTEHKIGSVIFDYIHTTTDLLSEYQNNSKIKMTVREDQVLSNLGLKLKDLCRKFNISIDSWTQVTGDFKNEANYDQTIIRGAKALADKIDCGAIVSRPTKKELKLLEPILRSSVHMNKPKPNICYSIYKNRGGKYNKIKIWLYVDYDTMRVHDQFCTDYDYNIITIPQTYIEIDEDQKINIVNEKKLLTRNLNEATIIMNQIEDDEIYIDDLENNLLENGLIEDTSSDVNETKVEEELSEMSPEEILTMKKTKKQLKKVEEGSFEEEKPTKDTSKNRTKTTSKKDNKEQEKSERDKKILEYMDDDFDDW